MAKRKIITSIFSKRTQKATSYKRKKYSRQYTKRIFKIANQRIKVLDNTKKTSQAVNELKQSGIFNFSMRGKSESELYRLYNKAINFLNNPTSTLSGLKEYANYIADKHGISKEVVDMLIHTEQEPKINEYLFMISRVNFYEVANGYRDIQEILQEQGFEENLEDFQVDIEMTANELRAVTLKRLNPVDVFNLIG